MFASAFIGLDLLKQRERPAKSKVQDPDEGGEGNDNVTCRSRMVGR